MRISDVSGVSPQDSEVSMSVRIILVVAFVVTTGSLAAAQITSASLSGTIKDETGGVLRGVDLVIRNLETGLTRSVVTDSNGYFAVPGLAPGTYEARASLRGFATGVQTGIVLEVAQQAGLNFILKLGATSENITVTSDSPLVDTREDRPNVKPGTDPRKIITGDPNHWFDTSVFELQPQGTFGNTPRDFLRGPGCQRRHVTGQESAFDGCYQAAVSVRSVQSIESGKLRGTDTYCVRRRESERRVARHGWTSGADGQPVATDSTRGQGVVLRSDHRGQVEALHEVLRDDRRRSTEHFPVFNYYNVGPVGGWLCGWLDSEYMVASRHGATATR